ncbi:MAG: VOC family protein [Chitinophagaceae bacterium]
MAIKTSIAPWLSIQNAAKAVDFYKKAFNAIETYRLEIPEGGGLVVKLSVNGAEFWVSGESVDEVSKQPAIGGDNIRMILTVSDPETLFTQAIEASGAEIFPVGVAHGWKLGRVVDPFGLHWEIGHPVE